MSVGAKTNELRECGVGGCYERSESNSVKCQESTRYLTRFRIYYIQW
jgi:hypothetical protein